MAWASKHPALRAEARVKRVTIVILAIGFGAAIVAFFAAAPQPANPLGYDPMDTKRYLHDLQMYGGTANVLAAQFRDWFTSLWYGRNLAYTIAVITVIVVVVYRFFAVPVYPMEVGPPKSD